MQVAEPNNEEILDRLRATYPGCIGVETNAGLVVVRRPSAEEVVQIEDAIGQLTDVGGKLNPYAGLDLIQSLLVYPTKDKAEELLQSYADFFTQIAAMARFAATDGQQPRTDVVDLKDSELYQRELSDDRGQHPKRHGGRIFAVEHYYMEADPDQPTKQRRIILGRYLMRRFGLVEHREFTKEVAATGFLNAEGNRVARCSTWARVARAHVVTGPGGVAVSGCDLPDWEKYPYLLVHLGIRVREESQLKIGNSAGKR